MKAIETAVLFAYCDRYATRAEKAGRGTQWPTVRQIKRRFRGASYQAVEDACANYVGNGYMGIAVGIGIRGVGAARLAENDCVVEAYV